MFPPKYTHTQTCVTMRLLRNRKLDWRRFTSRSNSRPRTWLNILLESISPTYLLTAFTHITPQKNKNSVKLSVSFYAFGIYARKNCVQNADEIDPSRFQQHFTDSSYVRRSQRCSKKCLFALLGSLRA